MTHSLLEVRGKSTFSPMLIRQRDCLNQFIKIGDFQEKDMAESSKSRRKEA